MLLKRGARNEQAKYAAGTDAAGSEDAGAGGAGVQFLSVDAKQRPAADRIGLVVDAGRYSAGNIAGGGAESLPRIGVLSLGGANRRRRRRTRPAKRKLPSAAEAWEEVEQQICAAGIYKPPVFSSELVRRAARAIGWLQLCSSENPAADRAHFLRLYESMKNKRKEAREIEQVMKIAGVGDLIRALAGSTQAADKTAACQVCKGRP